MTGDTWGRKSCTGAADPWAHPWAHTPADRRNQTGQTQKALANLKTAARERIGVDYRTAARCSIRSRAPTGSRPPSVETLPHMPFIVPPAVLARHRAI